MWRKSGDIELRKIDDFKFAIYIIVTQFLSTIYSKYATMCFELFNTNDNWRDYEECKH